MSKVTELVSRVARIISQATWLQTLCLYYSYRYCLGNTSKISKCKKFILPTFHFFPSDSLSSSSVLFVPSQMPSFNHTHQQSLVLSFSYTNSIISTPFSDQPLLELIHMPKITSPFTMKLSFSVLCQVMNAGKSDYVIHSEEYSQQER